AGYTLPQQDVELLQTIATEMALMIENADLRKKTELQSHRLDQAIIALEKISQALTAVTVGTDNLLRAVAHATSEILDVPYASLHLRRPAWRQQFSDVIVGATTRRELAAVRQSGEGAAQRVVRPEQVLELDLVDEHGDPLPVARVKKTREPLAIIMCDVDHFKAINDTVGHPAGDKVLQHLTRQILLPSVRPKDLVARYGGDEFVLVLRGTDSRAAVAVAERIRRTVGGQAVLLDGRAVSNLSLSLGIAVFPRDGETREALIQAADQALYVAKRTGRNRVVRSEAGSIDTQLAS